MLMCQWYDYYITDMYSYIIALHNSITQWLYIFYCDMI